MAKSTTTRKNVVDAVDNLGATESQKAVIDQVARYQRISDAKIAKARAALNEKYSKELEGKNKRERTRIAKELAAEQQKLSEKQEAEIAAYKLLAIKEVNVQEKKLQFEQAADLYKQKLLHATKLGEAVSANGKSYAENLLSSTTKFINDVGGSVEKYLDTYVKYYGAITTRLQNSGLTFESINKVYKANAAANPYYKYEDLLSNLSTLVEAGIASNVTQRAFLGTISQKIATTFNVAQESLLSIVRIQQKDTTAARLGLEANLTRLFNYYFEDTSYLNNLYDTVQEALIDTSSNLGATASVEFEYIVQKWLGSLGSVGVESSTLTGIAKAVNALGSGDIDYLTSNSAMQNLLVMASNRVGLDYSRMLTEGITSSQANTLLYGIIDYVQGIASSNNNVVKKQYAELFGVTVSDLVAFNNLTDSTIKSLYSAGMTYSDTLSELNSQLSKVASRTHISEMIDNVLNNTLMSIGIGVANNSALYGIYKAADMIESLTGGINLPFITAFGTGIDLNMSLEGLIKGGIIGFSAVSSLVSAIGSIFSGGMLNPDAYTVNSNKGSGFAGYNNAGKLQDTTSNVTTVSNKNSSGITSGLVEEQTAAGSEVSGSEDNITQDEMREFYDTVKNYLSSIDARLSGTLKVKQVFDPISISDASM